MDRPAYGGGVVIDAFQRCDMTLLTADALNISESKPRLVGTSAVADTLAPPVDDLPY
jgi:hypothetical protein